jgi:hypothetical protein
MPEEYEDQDEQYEDERPSRRGVRRRDTRPGKVQAIAIMTLIGGIYAILHFLGLAGGSTGFCCLWPGTYYSLVVGIFGIIKGSQLLGAEARLQAPPKGTAIMMIIDIINIDVICCVLGIVVLIFCSDPEVEEYLQGHG